MSDRFVRDNAHKADEEVRTPAEWPACKGAWAPIAVEIEPDDSSDEDY